MIIEKLTLEDVTSLRETIYKEIPLFFIFIFIKLSFIFILPAFIILYFFQITYKSILSENFACENTLLLITVLFLLLTLFLIILIVKFIKVDYPLKITCDFTIIDKKTISNTTDNTFIDSSYYYEIILINSEYRLKKKIQVDCQTYKKAKQNQIIKLKYYDVINKLIEASLNDERILNAKISVSPLRAMTYTLKRILESPSKKINKMKTKSKLLIIFLNLLVISCKGKIEPIGEKPLDLEGFDFTTKIDLLLPNKNISKEYIGVYEIKSKFRKNIIEKDTTFLDEFGDNKKAIGIEYRQNSSTSIDTLATYDKQVFSKINIATTLKNEIYVMSAVTSEITNTQINSFIEKLSETYGKYVKEEAEFGNNKFYIYEWQANDRIIKFSTIYNNESNTLKIEVSPNSLKVADKEPHYVGYFYVIKKENERMIKNLSTGDFAFIKP